MILVAVRIYRHAEPLETLQSEKVVFEIKNLGQKTGAGTTVLHHLVLQLRQVMHKIMTGCGNSLQEYVQ